MQPISQTDFVFGIVGSWSWIDVILIFIMFYFVFKLFKTIWKKYKNH